MKSRTSNSPYKLAISRHVYPPSFRLHGRNMNCSEMNVCTAGCGPNTSFPHSADCYFSQSDVSDNIFFFPSSSRDFNVSKVHATSSFFVSHLKKAKHHPENHPGCICLWNATATLKSYILKEVKGMSEWNVLDSRENKNPRLAMQWLWRNNKQKVTGVVAGV